MTNLVMLENISLAYGLEPLLDKVKFQITTGERICLIGRNGAGKSSLMKIIEGHILPDSGSVWRKPQLRIARLTQELPQELHCTVYEWESEGLAEVGKILAAYHSLILRLEQSHTEDDLKQLEQLQHQLDVKQGWQFEQQIKTILMRLQLNADDIVSQLSGGWQRRAALAKALVSAPDLLLLDEPTNHLDIQAIEWLESDLLASGVALLFITHDRKLLQRLATRIIELDRGQLTSWPGDYQNFLRRKEEMLHAEQMQNADFDKKLKQEEVWIRQGIKARRTRNEGRVRALEQMRNQRAKRREVQASAAFSLNEANVSGQLVIDAQHITHRIGERTLINDFSIRIMRGDRIGLIGPNGVGKSTLLNILLGKTEAQQGVVLQGTKLQIAYFDQLRKALDLERTVAENVVEGRDTIEVNGKSLHIISYLSDFLFTPERARTPVKALSGGECNRLLLAKLFSQPANLLVMDEPTNDLDIETLELLEELIANFQGTLLIVSHDRAFLDNVITSTLVFAGDGEVNEYVGGFKDIPVVSTQTKPAVIQEEKSAKSSAKVKTKLSFKEQKELTEMPKIIEKLETEQRELQELTTSADFYKQDQAEVAKIMARLAELEVEIAKTYLRWEGLEKLG
jgi:ATP-binding cassette subfamily F protein uup